MDYKYIEQLLERYWECNTSAEEEHILKVFFSQKDLPPQLARYKALFVYEQQEAKICLSEDFESRLLKAVGAQSNDCDGPPREVKVEKITLTRRLRPLYRAAAAVAIVTLLGNAAQHSFRADSNPDSATWDYNVSAYKDSYNDPQKAYRMSMEALQKFKEGPQTAAVDTTMRMRSMNKNTNANRDN